MSVEMLKTMRDDEFAKSQSHDGFKDKAWWEWGLGSDGELYCRGDKSGLNCQFSWHRFRCAKLVGGKIDTGFGLNLDFATMKKLVEAFK